MRVCMSQRPSAPLHRTVTFKIPMVKHRLQGRGLITVAVSDTVYCKPFGTKIDSQIHIIKTVAVVTVKLQETDELQTTVFFFTVFLFLLQSGLGSCPQWCQCVLLPDCPPYATEACVFTSSAADENMARTSSRVINKHSQSWKKGKKRKREKKNLPLWLCVTLKSSNKNN